MFFLFLESTSNSADPAAVPAANAPVGPDQKAEKANEAIDKTQKELDNKVDAIEKELNTAIDDQNKQAVAGQSVL